MNAKNQWRVFALAVLLAVTVNLPNAEAHVGRYELTVTTDGDASGSTYEVTGTVKRIGVAGENAYTNGYAFCSADAYTEAVGDSANLYKYAWASVRYEWEWDGPPGEEPGGSLYWENDGDGDATVSGENLNSGGSATSSGSASNTTRVSPPESSLSSMECEAQGSVTNNNLATGDASSEGDPADPHTIDPTKVPGCGKYRYAVSWNGFHSDTDSIPAGTTMFVLVGGAVCQCESDTDSSATMTGTSDASSTASVWAYASFTSN